MHTITLKVLEGSADTGDVVSTRKFNLDELVNATCEGEEADAATDLVLVFSNGDSIRIPAANKAAVLEAIAKAASDSGNAVQKDPSLIEDDPGDATNLNEAINLANRCWGAIKAMMTCAALAFAVGCSPADGGNSPKLATRDGDTFIVELGTASTNTMLFTASGITNYVSIVANPNLLNITNLANNSASVTLSPSTALYKLYTADATFPTLVLPSLFTEQSFYAFEFEWTTPATGFAMGNQVTWLQTPTAPKTVDGSGATNGVYRIALRYRGDTGEILGNIWMTTTSTP